MNIEKLNKIFTVTTFFLFMAVIANPTLCQESDALVTPDTNSLNIFDDKRLSIELFLHYPYHFLHSPDWLYDKRQSYNNYWNYGGGILVSKYFKIVKLETGFFISTRNYYHKLETTPILLIDKISYWNIPFSMSFKVWRIRLFASVIVTRPYAFNNLENPLLRTEINTLMHHPSWYYGGSQIPDNPLKIHLLTTGTLMLGIGYSQKINNSLNLNFALAYARKSITEDIKVYSSEIEPPGANLVEGRNSVVINLGIEFVFTTQKK